MKRAFAIVLSIWAAVCIIGCTSPEERGEAAPENHQIFCMDTEITLDAPAEGVLAALGEPVSYTERTSCAFEGLDKTYYFGSFYISTYPAADGDRIQSVWFADDTPATAEGITIGSSRSQVEQAYGKECFESGNVCTQTRGESTMTILLEGDTVVTVRYDADLDE